MSSFPAPYPMPNASGAAAEAANGAAGVYNSLQNRIAAAANQQATRKRQFDLDAQAQAQRQFENAMQMHAQGAIPADVVSGGPQIPGQPPPLRNRNVPNPAAQGAGTRIHDPQSGQDFYIPTDQEKGKSFVPIGQLGDSLKAAGWDGKSPLTPEQSHGIMQALNEAQPKDEPYEYDASGKYVDARTGTPVPGLVGKKTKKFYPIDISGGGARSRGDQQSSTPGAAPGGPFDGSGSGEASRGSLEANGNAYDFAPKEKEPKAPKSLHFETHTNDAGDVTTYGYDPETMELKSTHVGKGVGPKRKDPDAPKADKPMKMTSANARVIVQNKAKALSDAQKAYTKASAEAITDEDRAAANKDFRQAQQQAQLNYESEISAATGQEIPHNPWADAGASTPVRPALVAGTPGKTQTPAQAPAQPVAAPAARTTPKTAAQPAVAEGTIIVNKKTKARLILQGGQWKPAP